MDIMTLALCKANIIDLTQYQTSTGYSVNDIVLMLMADSMEANGAMQKIQFYDTDGAFKKTLSECETVYFKSVLDGATAVYPVFIGPAHGSVSQVVGDITLWFGGALVNISMCMAFYDNSTDATMYVASKVVYRDE